MSSTTSISVKLDFPCKYDQEAKVNVDLKMEEVLDSEYFKKTKQKLEERMKIDETITNDETFVRRIRSHLIHEFKCLEFAKNLDYEIRTNFKGENLIKDATSKRNDCIDYSVRDNLKISIMAELRNRHIKDGELRKIERIGVYLRESDPTIQSIIDIGEIKIEDNTESEKSKKTNDSNSIRTKKPKHEDKYQDLPLPQTEKCDINKESDAMERARKLDDYLGRQSPEKNVDYDQNDNCHQILNTSSHMTVDSEVYFNFKKSDHNNTRFGDTLQTQEDPVNSTTNIACPDKKQDRHLMHMQSIKHGNSPSDDSDLFSDDTDKTPDPNHKVGAWLIKQPIGKPMEENLTELFFQKLHLLSDDDLRKWIMTNNEETKEFNDSLYHPSIFDLNSFLMALQEVTACKVIIAYHKFVQITFPTRWNNKDYTMPLTELLNQEKLSKSNDMSIHGECVSMLRYKSELSCRDVELEYYKKKIDEYVATNHRLVKKYRVIKQELIFKEDNYVKEASLAEEKIANLTKQMQRLTTESVKSKSCNQGRDSQNSSELALGVSKPTSRREEMSCLKSGMLDMESNIKREVRILTEQLSAQAGDKTKEIGALKAEVTSLTKQLSTQSVDKLKEIDSLRAEIAALKVCSFSNEEVIATSKTQLIEAYERIDELSNALRLLEREKSEMLLQHRQKCDELNGENEKLRYEIGNISAERIKLLQQQEATVKILEKQLESNDEDTSVTKKKHRRRRGSKNSKSSKNSSDKKKSVPENTANANHKPMMTPYIRNQQMPFTNVTYQSKTPVSDNKSSLNSNSQPFYPIQVMGELNEYQQWIPPNSQNQNHNVQPTRLYTDFSTDWLTRRPTECNLDANNNGDHTKKPLIHTDDYTQKTNVLDVYEDNPGNDHWRSWHNLNAEKREEILGRQDMELNRGVKNEEDTYDKKLPRFHQVTNCNKNHNEKDSDADNDRLLKGLTFNGSNWAAFIKTFDMLNAKAGWSDEKAAWRFRFTLRDKALDVWGKLDDPVQRSYLMIKAQFQKFFGICDNPSILRQKLSGLKQEDKESIDDFYLKVLLMVRDAYPNCSQTTIDEIAYDIFLLGLRDDYIAALVRSTTKVKNLTTAYESAREHLVFKQSKAKVGYHHLPTGADIKVADVTETPIPNTSNIAKAGFMKNQNSQYNNDRKDNPRDSILANQRNTLGTQGRERTLYSKPEEREEIQKDEDRMRELFEKMFHEKIEELPRDTDRRNPYSKPRSQSGNSDYSSRYSRFKPRYGKGQCYDCGSRNHYKGSKYCRAYDRHYSGSPDSGYSYDRSGYNRKSYYRNQDKRHYEVRRYRSDNPNWRDKGDIKERKHYGDNKEDRKNRSSACSINSREHDFSDEDFSCYKL